MFTFYLDSVLTSIQLLVVALVTAVQIIRGHTFITFLLPRRCQPLFFLWCKLPIILLLHFACFFFFFFLTKTSLVWLVQFIFSFQVCRSQGNLHFVLSEIMGTHVLVNKTNRTNSAVLLRNITWCATGEQTTVAKRVYCLVTVTSSKCQMIRFASLH